MNREPVCLHDGLYETRIVPLKHSPRAWWWCVTHTATKAQRSGRSSSEMFARHDARKALSLLRREAGEEQAA